MQVEQLVAIGSRHLRSEGLLQAKEGRPYVLAGRWGDGCSEQRLVQECNPMRRVRSSEKTRSGSKMGTKSWLGKEPMWLRIELQQLVSTRKSDVDSEGADEEALALL